MKTINIKFVVIVFVLFSLFLLTIPVKAETIIYDNITTSQYKTFKIVDDINIKYINDYTYDIYINSSFLGTYKKEELIYVPDNSSVNIVINGGIKTDMPAITDYVKPSITLIVAFFFTFGVFIFVVIWIIRKIWRI